MLALAVRLVVLWQLRDADFSHVLFGDAAQYDRWAQTIASGDWIGHGVFYQSPLYPYALGAIYALLGRHLPVIRMVQGIGDAVACAMIAVTARRLFGGAAGWAAGLLAAVYGPALFFIADIQKSSLDLLLVSALVFAATPPERELSLNRCAVSGIVAGLLALNRENALVLIVPVALWCYACSSRRRLAAVAVVCAAAVVLVPVGLRNWEVGGEFHLTTSQLGPNLYIGNNPQADGTYVPLVKGHGSAEYEQDDATDLAQAALGRTLTPEKCRAIGGIERSTGFARIPAGGLG